MAGFGRGRGRALFQGDPFAPPEENQNVRVVGRGPGSGLKRRPQRTILEPKVVLLDPIPMPDRPGMPSGWSRGFGSRSRGIRPPIPEMLPFRPVSDTAEESEESKSEDGQNGERVLWNVESLPDLPLKKVHKWKVRRVVSPHEFYVGYADMPNCRNYELMSSRMQTFYKDLDNQTKLQLKKRLSAVSSTGRCFAFWNTEDRLWHRVRVLHVDEESESVAIFYLDLCIVKQEHFYTLRLDLLELDPQFLQIPSQVFQCYLADIRPSSGIQEWDATERAMFQELLKEGAVVSGVVLTRSDLPVWEGMPNLVTTLGVVIRLHDPQTGKLLPGCTVNAILVDEGAAVATGVFGGCQHVAQEMQKLVPSFEMGRRRTYDKTDSDEEDKSIVMEQTELWDSQIEELNEFRRPENLAKEFWAKNQFLPLEIKESLVAVLVDAYALFNVFSLDRICVHFLSQKNELDAMEKAIEQQVINEACFEDGESGMFVACQMNKDSKGEWLLQSHWVRGLITFVEDRLAVKDVVGLVKYKVYLVDYGILMSVHFNNVRALPQKFQEIPSFAVRVHLDGDRFQFVEGPWRNRALKTFRFLVHGHPSIKNTKKRAQHGMSLIYLPPNAETVELHHPLQGLVYNPTLEKWTVIVNDPNEAEYASLFRDVKNPRKHPLLASSYRSVGVDMSIEVRNPKDPFWQVVNILDMLEKCGEMESRASINSQAQNHLDVLEMAG